MPGTACAKAIQIWAEKNAPTLPEEAAVVKLMALQPPIDRMDASLNGLTAVRHLSLSTNAIPIISPISLKNLEILSLGRNMIKKISGLEEVGATLKELWLSYNQIATLDGLTACVKLQTLYISNNKIKDWAEVRKLSAVSKLGNVTLVGNPIYDGLTRKTARPEVVKNFPQCKVLDGEMVTDADTGVDEIVMEARGKVVALHGSAENAMVTQSELADPTRVEIIPSDVLTSVLVGLGLDEVLAGKVYSKIDWEKKGGATVQQVRRAFGIQ